MKNRKRVLSVLLALAVVFTMCITAAVAVDTGSGSAAKITVDTVKKAVKVGDTVTLNVSIAGNPGFAGYKFKVNYDANKLTLEDVVKGTFVDGLFTSYPAKNSVAFANTTDSLGDGTLFTLKFTVKADCSNGADVTIESAQFVNAAQKPVSADIVAGGINVTTGGSTTGGSTTGGSTTGGSTTGGSTTGGGTTGGGTTGGGTTAKYEIIEGANGTWTQNSDGTLTVRANGEFSKFDYVKVDGKRIDSKNYTAKSGSTIVTLSKDYLATLSVGDHALAVVFNDGGEARTNFTVNAVTPDNPQTGDHSGIVLAVAVLLVSGGALTVLGIAKKKAGKC